MKYLDLTLPGAAPNLACDEALLDWAETAGGEEILRIWEPEEFFVVTGYANRVGTEVHLDRCDEAKIPVLRRCTGGGTVLQGPGCLNYSLILRIPETGPLSTIQGTNRYVLERHREMAAGLLNDAVQIQGQIDLTLAGRKFSGNAQRRRRAFLLFHGTFLLGLDLERMEALLRLPSKEPDYRAGRAHLEFVRNIPLSAERLRDALRGCWGADEPFECVPWEAIRRMSEKKYSQESWNFKFE